MCSPYQRINITQKEYEKEKKTWNKGTQLLWETSIEELINIMRSQACQ